MESGDEWVGNAVFIEILTLSHKKTSFESSLLGLPCAHDAIMTCVVSLLMVPHGVSPSSSTFNSVAIPIGKV